MFKSWTMNLSYVKGHFSMVYITGHTFHGPITKIIHLKAPLGTWLGVNQMWTKRSDHAPKVDVLIYICPKRAVLEQFFMFDLLPFFPSFLVTMDTFGKNNNNNNNKTVIPLSWSPDICNKRTSFALPLQNPLNHDSG